MSPECLMLQPMVTEIFERILFIWAIRHPASGYVQGINDLVTPFFVVYVFEYIKEEVENFDVSSLQEETLRNIEADSFWCMSKLLDGIQDNYTFAQPGIQRKVKALEELVSRIDETVHVHMQQYEVEYLQFAFRWMNNLLMRELPLRCTIRLWDTYQVHTHTTNTHVRTHTYCARTHTHTHARAGTHTKHSHAFTQIGTFHSLSATCVYYSPIVFFHKTLSSGGHQSLSVLSSVACTSGSLSLNLCLSAAKSNEPVPQHH
uniref:Rab-GAP TBC domain-containing protein n=1 Tax=Hucho hucho TaxID=62062 RepID=A0A4W5LCY1_9TELE